VVKTARWESKIYTNGIKNEPISHTREIGEILAKDILKRNGIIL